MATDENKKSGGIFNRSVGSDGRFNRISCSSVGGHDRRGWQETKAATLNLEFRMCLLKWKKVYQDIFPHVYYFEPICIGLSSISTQNRLCTDYHPFKRLKIEPFYKSSPAS